MSRPAHFHVLRTWERSGASDVARTFAHAHEARAFFAQTLGDMVHDGFTVTDATTHPAGTMTVTRLLEDETNIRATLQRFRCLATSCEVPA